MLVSLDFDHTFTGNPHFWKSFLELCSSKKMDVICVTYRPEEDREFVQSTFSLYGINLPIFCTGGVAKQEFMENKNIYVDIWVDDDPFTIVANNVI